MAMVEGYLADPADWTGEASTFLMKTLQRWRGTLRGEEVDRSFGFNLQLSAVPGEGAELDDDVGPPFDRFYLQVFSQLMGHWVVELRPVIDRLGKVHPRLPGLWWHMVQRAVDRYAVTWGFEEALEAEEFGSLGDLIEDMEASSSDPEALNKMRPSSVIPKSMRNVSVKPAGVRRLLKKLGLTAGTSWAGAMMWGALDAYELASKEKVGWFPELTEAERQVLYHDDSSQPAPSLLCVIEEGDGLAHLWDWEGDVIHNSASFFAPVFCMPIEADGRGLHDAFERLRRMMTVLRIVGRTLHLVKHPNDTLPLSYILGEAEGPEEPAIQLRVTV